MADKKGSSSGPSEREVKEMEKATVEKVGNTLKVIENALQTWDASKTKPQDLFPRVMKLKEFHNALEEWNRKMQTSLIDQRVNSLEVSKTSSGEDVDFRVARLREFVDICYKYE